VTLGHFGIFMPKHIPKNSAICQNNAPFLFFSKENADFHNSPCRFAGNQHTFAAPSTTSKTINQSGF
jgi:hypothetical protein